MRPPGPPTQTSSTGTDAGGAPHPAVERAAGAAAPAALDRHGRRRGAPRRAQQDVTREVTPRGRLGGARPERPDVAARPDGRGPHAAVTAAERLQTAPA